MWYIYFCFRTDKWEHCQRVNIAFPTKQSAQAAIRRVSITNRGYGFNFVYRIVRE